MLLYLKLAFSFPGAPGILLFTMDRDKHIREFHIDGIDDF
jgi:hypothetical protein